MARRLRVVSRRVMWCNVAPCSLIQHRLEEIHVMLGYAEIDCDCLVRNVDFVVKH